MNVRIFWVCEMECMCAQTRPWFIFLSKRGFFESSLMGAQRRVETRNTASCRTASPTHYWLSYSRPLPLPLSHPAKSHWGRGSVEWISHRDCERECLYVCMRETQRDLESERIRWVIPEEVNWEFPTRMVYLYYIPCLRYTILVGNPQNASVNF